MKRYKGMSAKKAKQDALSWPEGGKRNAILKEIIEKYPYTKEAEWAKIQLLPPEDRPSAEADSTGALETSAEADSTGALENRGEHNRKTGGNKLNGKQLWILSVGWFVICLAYMILFGEPDCLPSDWSRRHNDCDDFAKYVLVPPITIAILNALYSAFKKKS